MGNQHASPRREEPLKIFALCIVAALVILLPAHAASATDANLVPLTEQFANGRCLYPTWAPTEHGSRTGNSSCGSCADGSRRPGSVEPHCASDGAAERGSRFHGATGNLDVWTIRSDGTKASRLVGSRERPFISGVRRNKN